VKRSLTPTVGLLFLLACTRGNPVEPAQAPSEAPVPQGTYVDENQVEHTIVQIAGVLHYGEQVTKPLPSTDTLVGWEFEAQPGDQPSAVLGLTKGEGELALSLHGPRSAVGLWDRALAAADGSDETPAFVKAPSLSGGFYLLLVRSRGASAGAEYTLRLECHGHCGEPACPDVAPCDLVCRTGFEADDRACRLCECITPSCTPETCKVDEECGADGACHPRPHTCEERCPNEAAPVCGADGQTFPNACIAACRGQRDVRPGVCPPPPPHMECDEQHACPEGKLCQDGHCMPRPCECPDTRDPVCGPDGQTWRNEACMRCALGPDTGVAYHGECVQNRCAGNEQCPDGWVCSPVASVPENRVNCREPDAEACVRQCVPQPHMRGCSNDHPCPAGLVCVPQGDGGDGGICVGPCRLGQPDACPGGLVCAAVNQAAAARGLGLCGIPCGDGHCSNGLECREDLNGQAVCQAQCHCGGGDNQQPVCAGDDDRPFPSACQAACYGYRAQDLHRCPEEPPPPPPSCDCPPGPDFVCGADGRFYASACEAACHGQDLRDPSRCFVGGSPHRECRTDDDCFRTGCGDRFCASAETQACGRFSTQAECLAGHGRCGCSEEGLCATLSTPEADACAAEHDQP
jgi:hypothetical protein